MTHLGLLSEYFNRGNGRKWITCVIMFSLSMYLSFKSKYRQPVPPGTWHIMIPTAIKLARYLAFHPVHHHHSEYVE